MSVSDFLDTNVLVSAYDRSQPKKQQIAQAILRRAIAGECAISTQVLAEFTAILLYKVSPRVSPKDVALLLEALSPVISIHPNEAMVKRAVEAQERYGIHFYDGMVVAAAEQTLCRRIYSDGRIAGRKYFGIPVVNPFRT